MIRPRITMLGDSLTAGYGLRASEALPVRLEAELTQLGRPVTVTNAGRSGDTTGAGLRRMDRDVPLDTALCLVALGANDMMQRIPVPVMEANLDAILRRLADLQIPAMVCAMRAPPWFGSYASAFDKVFPAIASRHGAALDPFMLEGVALNPAFVLPDRIHPNAAGVAAIARKLAPRVHRVLAQPDQRPQSNALSRS